jgi:outer membrane protein OmpA-like peptidoglycan-associated protein
MGVKSLIFLGLIMSALFVYLCIDSKKDAFYASINQKTPKVVAPTVKEKPLPAPIVATKYPSFAYVSGAKSKVAALLATKDQNGTITKMIDNICGENGCVKDIKYFEDTKEFIPSDQVLDLINFSIEKNIDKFAIYIDQKIVKVDGELKDISDKDEIDLKLKYFVDNKYDVSNNTHIKDQKPKVKPKEKHNIVEALQESKVVKEVIENQSKVITDEENKTVAPKKDEVKKEIVKKEEPKIVKEVIENQSKVITDEENKTVTPKKDEVKKEIVKKAIEKTPVKKEEPKIVKEVKKSKVVKPVKKPKKVVKKIEPIKEKVIEDVSVDDVFVIPEHISVEEASYRVSDLLIAEPIIFEEDGQISIESQNTLNKIADILLGQDGVTITVLGHTYSAEDPTYSRVISQKRADSVRNYLVKSGLRRSIIRSVGYGDGSISDDPSYTSIEIKIKEGR